MHSSNCGQRPIKATFLLRERSSRCRPTRCLTSLVPPIHSSPLFLSPSFFLPFFLLRVFRLFSTRHGRFRTRPPPSFSLSLSSRILIPFLRTSLHANQDNATAPGGRNELQRRKEILFLPWKRPTFSGIPITGHRYYCISFGIWRCGDTRQFFLPRNEIQKIRAQTFPIININIIESLSLVPRIFYADIYIYIYACPTEIFISNRFKCGGNFDACFFPFLKILSSFFRLPWKNLQEIVFRACVGPRYLRV